MVLTANILWGVGGGSVDEQRQGTAQQAQAVLLCPAQDLSPHPPIITTQLQRMHQQTGQVVAIKKVRLGKAREVRCTPGAGPTPLNALCFAERRSLIPFWDSGLCSLIRRLTTPGRQRDCAAGDQAPARAAQPAAGAAAGRVPAQEEPAAGERGLPCLPSPFCNVFPIPCNRCGCWACSCTQTLLLVSESSPPYPLYRRYAM